MVTAKTVSNDPNLVEVMATPIGPQNIVVHRFTTMRHDKQCSGVCSVLAHLLQIIGGGVTA